MQAPEEAFPAAMAPLTQHRRQEPEALKKPAAEVAAPPVVERLLGLVSDGEEAMEASLTPPIPQRKSAEAAEAAGILAEAAGPGGI